MTVSLFSTGRSRRRAARPRADGSPRAAGGFTLVELLVATTVTLLLVVVLMQVFNGAAGTWRHSEAQIDAYREARGALQLMARDLSTTLQASYAQAGGGADPTPTPGTTANPTMPTLVLQHYPGGPSYSGGPINEEVYCLTNISNHGASSLCAVGYFCQWMADDVMFPRGTPDVRPQAFALMRQSLDSNGTFLRMQAAATHHPLLGFPDLYQRNLNYNAGVSNPPNAVATQVAAYVWDLHFRIDTDLDESTVANGNNPVPNDHSTNPSRSYNGDASQPYPPRLPPYLEIRFKALSSLAGRRLEGSNTGVDPGTWASPNSVPYKQIIQPNYQQFVLRVPLFNATPLPTP